ncbi:hypothetical protein LIER_36066 [Lithospermum erythrorhizon]|uniref:Uncharacterized protein n=1 Tax=Lithospermum erythrorhizon TaxID=34254 RepID=A0AAV3P051_LITER
MSGPQDMPKFDFVCDLLNNGHSFALGDVRNETKCVRTNFLDGDDKFSLKVLNDCLFCSGSNNSHVPDSQTVLLYDLRMGLPINIPGLTGNIIFDSIEYRKNCTYPLGILISFIVKRCAIMECGPRTPPPSPLGNRTIRYQLLQFDDAKVHLLAKRKKGLPIDDDDVHNVQGEDVHVEGDVRTGNFAREDSDLQTELRHLATIHEQQGNDIKKNKCYLKGIMKFLSCFDKREGSSSEA